MGFCGGSSGFIGFLQRFSKGLISFIAHYCSMSIVRSRNGLDKGASSVMMYSCSIMSINGFASQKTCKSEVLKCIQNHSNPLVLATLNSGFWGNCSLNHA